MGGFIPYARILPIVSNRCVLCPKEWYDTLEDDHDPSRSLTVEPEPILTSCLNDSITLPTFLHTDT